MFSCVLRQPHEVHTWVVHFKEFKVRRQGVQIVRPHATTHTWVLTEHTKMHVKGIAYAEHWYSIHWCRFLDCALMMFVASCLDHNFGILTVMWNLLFTAAVHVWCKVCANQLPRSSIVARPKDLVLHLYILDHFICWHVTLICPCQLWFEGCIAKFMRKILREWHIQSLLVAAFVTLARSCTYLSLRLQPRDSLVTSGICKCIKEYTGVSS